MLVHISNLQLKPGPVKFTEAEQLHRHISVRRGAMLGL